MIKRLPNIVFVAAILVFVANIIYIWQSPAMKASWMGNDEYFFYRTTMNLPNYNTTGAWLIEDVAPNPDVDNPTMYIYSKAYTTPVWVHPLLANCIAYPIAILFDDVPRQIQWLRLVDIVIIVATLFFLLDIVRRRTNPYIAALSVLPMLVGRLLLANGIMFYNDLFMWLFFAFTMWVISVKPDSKWIILLTLVTVMTKINAVLLLIPLLIYLYYMTKSKSSIFKVVVPSVIVLAGYIVFQCVVSGDVFYLAHHWGSLNTTAKRNIAINVFPHFLTYMTSWGLWMSIPLLLLGIVRVIKNRIESFYGFVAFGVVTLLFGYAWGSYAYQVYPTMYASVFMVPVLYLGRALKKGDNKEAQIA